MENNPITIDTEKVKSRMIAVRGQQALLDRDVAALYGVETREINQAVRNNTDKFPNGYVIELNEEEVVALRSKFLTLETSGHGRGKHSKHGYKAFTARVVSDNLTTESSETEIELNFAIVKIRHKVIKRPR